MHRISAGICPRRSRRWRARRASRARSMHWSRELAAEARAGDQVLVMSNGGFGGMHDKLLGALRSRATP